MVKEETEKNKKSTYTEAIGRRKASTARVRLTPSPKTEYRVNDKPMEIYFITGELRHIIMGPISEIEQDANFLITVKTSGGGIHSQAEAVRVGIARALTQLNPERRVSMKKNGFLTRDARMKERRKFGLKKARRAPQWSKR